MTLHRNSVQFTMVPFKALSDKVGIRYPCFCLHDCFIFFDFSAKVPGVFHVLEIIKNLSELNTEFESLISDLTQDINCQCTGMHQVNPTGSFQKIDR